MLLTGLGSIMDEYDGYLIDLWGVVHDGAHVYPGALETLKALQDHNKKVVLLSNGPRRVHVAHDRLAKLGVTSDLYTAVHTSGEQTYHLLAQQAKGQSFFHIGTERDDSLFEGLNLIKTDNIQKADFILCTDTLVWDQAVHDLDPVFTQALALKLPLICANPDRVVFYQGGLKWCAGTLAHRYQEMGGNITLIGKPHPEVYATALSHMPNVSTKRILAIGDSLRTDIQGALTQGIDGVLITGGIHMPDLGNAWGELPDAAAVKKVCAQYNITPRYVMGSLVL